MYQDVDSIINDLKNRKENLDPAFLKSLDDYTKTFVQRWPRYGIKSPGRRRWRTKKNPLADPAILANLYGKYTVGMLAQWYPRFFGIDIDNQPTEFVDHVRESLRLDESNSMLFMSERPNCYHLYGRPTINGKPPTTNRLQSAFKSISAELHFEIYPQAKRFFRAPFSPMLLSVDPAYYHLDTWQDKMYWFDKLDEVDISQIPSQQLSLDLRFDTPVKITNTLQEGKDLYNHGLLLPSSRHDSQFKVLYYLWRINIPQDQAVCMTMKWIRENHNGFSKDIIRYPRQVKGEIDRQSSRIYEKYELSNTYPDSTNNLYNGYLSASDIPEIFRHCRGSLSRSKFLFYLLKYSYPRRHRDFINIHSDKLIGWSSFRTYLKYIDEFKSAGLLERGTAYSPGEFSKDLKLNWKYRSTDEAILYDGRAIDTLDDTVRFLYKPGDYRELLRSSGAVRTTAYEAAMRAFSRVSEKAKHR